jgi:4-hydroxy-3-polyprenylbenzoate decarboxylase
MTDPIFVAITGASGVIYGRRLVEVLLEQNPPVHLSISDSGQKVLEHELGIRVELDKWRTEQFLPDGSGAHELVYHHYKDFMAPVASGSFRTRAMVICPCSGSTLSAIAAARSENLIQRAAEVHLKERRPLILVPRETPLSLPHIRNLEIVARAGATVLPASPGFYHGARSVEHLVDFIVSRILDQLGIDNSLIERHPGTANR